MHHFIFPTQDTWISSGSSTITGESFRDQNFGRDQILEVKKEFFNNSFNFQTRALVNFAGTDFNEMSQSIVKKEINNPRFFLRLFEAEGNAELSEEYKLAIQPISQSWVEGTGKFGDNPKNTNGCSWENRSNPIGGTALQWQSSTKPEISVYLNSTGTLVNSASVQSFSNESPDVNVDITDMMNMWLTGSGAEQNYGMLIRFSGSQETDSTTFGHLKFFFDF